MYDTSTGDPTSYLWVIDEEDQPWIYVSPSKYNYTANPAVTISGTGVGYILHQVTNPAGTSACALLPFNISGVAPTPSPTPAIPFPNQTGICQYSSITLGSGGTESFERYFNLNRPDGSVMSDYYASGARAYVTGTSYTSQLGTYIYNQYNASEELMYRSSYNVIDCQVIPTVTRTPIPTQTLIQTFPTVTGTLSPYWNTTVIPTVQPYSTIPSSLPSLSEGALNQTHTEEILVDFSPALATYINLVKGTLTDANNFFMYPVILALSPVANIANMLVYVLALFTQYFSTFTPMFTLPYSVFTNLFNAMHWKLKGVITFGLIIDTILMVYYLKRGRF